MKNDIGKANERWVEARRSWSGADAFAEFRAATGERIARCGPSTTTASAPTRGRPWARAPSASCSGSASSTRGSTSRTCAARSAAPATWIRRPRPRRTAMMCDVMPYVVGKKVGAPDGSTVVLMLTGPLVRTVAVGVVRRPRPAPRDPPDPPTVSSRWRPRPSRRLACGRARPRGDAGHGRSRIEGDVDLGGQIVRQFNYMF